MADPEETHSKSEFAQEIKVSLRTLFRWQEKEGFWDAVYELAMMHLKAELAPVLQALARQAGKGDLSAIRLLLQHTGKLIERQRSEQDIKVTISWDEEEEAMASCGAS